MSAGQFITKETAVVSSQASSAPIDVEDLDNITVHVVATVDGTVTLQVQKSVDGTNWVSVGSTVAGSALEAGVTAVERPVVDPGGGKPVVAKRIRLTATAYTSGSYKAVIAGRLVGGYSS